MLKKFLSTTMFSTSTGFGDNSTIAINNKYNGCKNG